MTKTQALILLGVLLIGWGGAACIAIFTGRTGLAAFVFLATLAVFCYWPLSRRKGK
jgi:hypothetical protein